MIYEVVCVFVIQGLLVKAFPMGQYNGDDAGVPVEGVAEFSGNVPASGSATLLGSFGCPQVLPASEPSTIYLENDGNECPDISETAMFASILVDSILAEKEEKINQKLAEVDTFVESELEKVDKIMQSSISNIKITDEKVSLNLDLLEIESKIASELVIIDDFIASELETTEKQIRSVLAEVEDVAESKLAATESSMNSAAVELEKQMTTHLAEQEFLVKSEIAEIEYKMEAKLDEINAFIESELAKVDSFVESQLAITEALVKSEVDKVNLFIESKLLTEDLVDPKLSDLSDFVESELAPLEIPLQGVAEFSGVVPAYGRTIIIGSTGFLTPNLGPLKNNPEAYTAECPKAIPITDRIDIIENIEYSPILDFKGSIKETKTEFYDEYSLAEPAIVKGEVHAIVPVVGEVGFSGVAPAVGSVKIVRNFGCDPLFPLNPSTVDNAEPNVENKPLPISVNNDRSMLPMTEEAMTVNIPDSDRLLPQIDKLTTANIVDKQMEFLINDEKPIEEAVVHGDVEFSGSARATGRTRLVAEFGCPPLMPTAETADGKKYLWLAKRPNRNAPPHMPRKTDSSNIPDFPRKFPMSTFSHEFPETVIMDSTKNYERHIEEYEQLKIHDHFEDDIKPVVGEVSFGGKAPAFGAVSITAHSVY